MIVLYNAKDYEAELKSGEGVYWQSSEPIDLRQKDVTSDSDLNDPDSH